MRRRESSPRRGLEGGHDHGGDEGRPGLPPARGGALPRGRGDERPSGATRQAFPRLVEDERPRPDPRALRVYRQAAAQETVLARETARDPSFAPGDPRWRFAREVEAALEGAVLAFEERRRLLSLAQRLGIRAFDANLIVALVQDRARRGEPVETAAATIAMVPVAPNAGQRLGQLFAAAIVVAMLFDLALIAWLIVG
jgi:hypothetical protein